MQMDIILTGDDSRRFAWSIYKPSLEEMEYWGKYNKDIRDSCKVIEEYDGGFVVECKDLDLSFINQEIQ